MEPNRPSSSSSSQSRTSRDLHCWDPCSFYIYCSSVTAMSHISPSPECWPISGSPHLFKNSSSQFSYPWRCSVPWFGYRRMLKPRFPIWGSPLMGHAHPAELERKCAKVAWPSGLRRWFKAPVSSEAWVRIPPLPGHYTFSLLCFHNVSVQFCILHWCCWTLHCLLLGLFLVWGISLILC